MITGFSVYSQNAQLIGRKQKPVSFKGEEFCINEEGITDYSNVRQVDDERTIASFIAKVRRVLSDDTKEPTVDIFSPNGKCDTNGISCFEIKSKEGSYVFGTGLKPRDKDIFLRTPGPLSRIGSAIAGAIDGREYHLKEVRTLRSVTKLYGDLLMNAIGTIMGHR